MFYGGREKTSAYCDHRCYVPEKLCSVGRLCPDTSVITTKGAKVLRVFAAAVRGVTATGFPGKEKNSEFCSNFCV